MYVLKSICFVCLTGSDKNNTNIVFRQETEDEIFKEVKYALPELMILNPKIPLYICSTCHTTLRSFSLFKKKCLENYSNLNNHIQILQGSNDTPGQSFNELQIEVINCDPLVNHENDIHLNMEEDEDPLQSWEKQHDLKTETGDDIDVKEEQLVSADRNFYQELVKSVSVSNDERDGSSSVASEDNSVWVESNSNTNTESRVFQCSFCNEVFSDEPALNTHLRSHITNMTDLKCEICERKLVSRSSYIIHMKYHLGIKDFKCTICNKKFTRNSELNIHKKIHEETRDYECSVCKKTFIRKQSLKRHAKTHEGIK